MKEEPLELVALTCNLMLGGATSFLLNFLRGLEGTPHRLRVVCVGDAYEMAGDFARLGADVRTAKLSGRIYEDRLAWAYEQAAESQPHAVLAALGAESFEVLRVAPPGVARLGLIQADDRLPYEMASRYPASLDAMVGVSRRIAEKLRAEPAFQRTRVEAIPYGIAFGEDVARQLRPPDEPLRVIYLGRLIEEQKRISRIIELVQRMESQPAAVHFTIAGSGPDEAAVHQALAGRTNVTLRGPLPNSEVPAVFRAHDVFILLSDYEGLPLSLLEAMGEGVVPVVTKLESGISDVVTSACGLQIEHGDVPLAIEALLRLSRDRELLSSLSAGAKLEARTNYSANAMVGRYLALIRSVAGERPRPVWPSKAQIPRPFVPRSWLYEGFPRQIRRGLKSLLRSPA
jgi:glycosyltransferase involved in cell wall biosynthesis